MTLTLLKGHRTWTKTKLPELDHVVWARGLIAWFEHVVWTRGFYLPRIFFLRWRRFRPWRWCKADDDKSVWPDLVIVVTSFYQIWSLNSLNLVTILPDDLWRSWTSHESNAQTLRYTCRRWPKKRPSNNGQITGYCQQIWENFHRIWSNWSLYLQEVGVQLTGHGSGEEGFPRSRRAVEEATFRRCDSHPLEQLRIQQGQFDDLKRVSHKTHVSFSLTTWQVTFDPRGLTTCFFYLTEFSNLFRQSTDFRVAHIAGVCKLTRNNIGLTRSGDICIESLPSWLML